MKTLKELKELYKTLGRYVDQYDDGFIYAIWYKDKNEFLEYMKNLNNRRLSDLTIGQIKIINLCNKYTNTELKVALNLI